MAYATRERGDQQHLAAEIGAEHGQVLRIAPAEQALGPQQDDEQEDDEDRRVLQLVRQEQRRQLLHQADGQAAQERAETLPKPPSTTPAYITMTYSSPT